jgi:hypothetical protein
VGVHTLQIAGDLLEAVKRSDGRSGDWHASIGLAYGPVTVAIMPGQLNAMTRAFGDAVTAAEEIAGRISPWRVGVMSMPEHLAARSLCLDNGHVVRY